MRRFRSRPATTSAWESLAPEFRVLCLAARCPQTSADGAALRAVIGEGVDWQSIVQGAHRHRIAAMVLSGFRAHGDLPVPVEVIADLHRLAAVNARRALAQAAEVVRLAGLLADRGVRVLVLKGVAMSLQLHGDLALRGVGDIDLLVAPADFAAADAVLMAIGYRRLAPSGDPIPGAVDWAAYRDLTYESPDRSATVELHQHLTANRHRLPQDFDRLWLGRGEMVLADQRVAVLPQRLLPLYLCVHGAHHCWARLCWLSDLAALQRAPGVRAVALADAEAAGLGDAMRLALALADEFLGSSSEGGAVAARSGGVQVRRFAARFFAGTAWLELPAPAGIGWLRFEAWRRLELYSMKAGWRHVWHELRADFLNPVDRTVIPLPKRVRWLYPFLRPVGWVLRNLRRRAGGQRRT